MPIDCLFFFQAEDGIRDGHVTGVQTCALPICRLDYSLDLFESTDEDTVVSNTATLGWARQFGPNTSAAVRLGPRFTNGDVGVEAGLDFAQRFRYATLSLAYARTQTVATGQSGVQDVDSFAVGVGFPP